MIDTIKLAYPLDSTLSMLFDKHTERLQKISPDGDLLWEKSTVRGDCMPSHYSGLRVTLRRKSDMLDLGFDSVSSKIKDLVFFEFSLQKWQSPSAYNNLNTHLSTDLKALDRWIRDLSCAVEFVFRRDLFTLYRCDLSRNHLLLNAKIEEFIRCAEITFSTHHASDGKMFRTGHSIAHRSPDYLGKKIYSKWHEFDQVERKKHPYLFGFNYLTGQTDAHIYKTDLKPLSTSELADLQRMLRFEMEFKRKYMEAHNMRTIDDIPKLVPKFEQECAKFMSVALLDKMTPDFTPQEKEVVEFVRIKGYKSGRDQYVSKYSRATWFRHKASLAQRGVFLESLDNSEFRLKGLDLFYNPERLQFQLIEAPYADYDLAAAA